MAVLNRDEFLSTIRQYIGEGSDDKSLSFLEDMTDTYDSMYNLTKEETSWKAKYEENDANWRNKYRERFYSNETNDEPEDESGGETKILTFADLFTKGGK